MREDRDFHNGRVQLLAGDCLARLDELDENSIDAVLTDPPYHLASIVKRFATGVPVKGETMLSRAYQRMSKGFMGHEWDGGQIAFEPATWAKVLRVLKPGGYMIAFAAAKNAHHMISAIEQGGFEIRDQLLWLYGNGFPKSKSMDEAGEEWQGWGSALKPAYEPMCLARKPLSESSLAKNLLRWGVGAINIDSCRISAQAAGLGRWPANVLHDGSELLESCFIASAQRDLQESPLRFFYSTKAKTQERHGSQHPTVKPVALMRYGARMICPKGGVLLDPFAGTGTSGEAAVLEDMRAILIEREVQYRADIARRLERVFASDLERQKFAAEPETPGPLFD